MAEASPTVPPPRTPSAPLPMSFRSCPYPSAGLGHQIDPDWTLWGVMMLRLFRNLFRQNSRKIIKPRQYRPTVECLEQREVMSVSGSEQLFIYLLNRARHDPAAYAQEQNLSVSLSGVEPRAPLALNNLLSNS